MRHFLPIFLLLFVLPLQAANQQYFAYTRHPTIFYKSKLEGCQDLAHAYINSSWTIISFHSMVSNGNSCGYTAKTATGSPTGPVTGTTPVLVGTCVQGESASITWPIGPTDAANPTDIIGTANLPPNPACSYGCMVGVGEPSDCYTFQDGSSPYTFCDFDGQKTGAACSTTDEPVPPDSSSCPPGTVASGSACAPETPPDPCEADPNAAGCTPPDPCLADPNAAGCPGDGGTDPGDGATDPGDRGTDPGDGGTDPGDGGTDPGDGGTDPGHGGGDGGTDPIDDDHISGIGSCDQTLVCSGDPIACAQSELQKAILCRNNLDYPNQTDEIEDFLNQSDFQEGEVEEVNVGDLVKEGTRFLPSSCPAPLTASLSGGRSISISYEPICKVADSISYLFVALAWVFFAVYVGRSSGGD